MYSESSESSPGMEKIGTRARHIRAPVRDAGQAEVQQVEHRLRPFCEIEAPLSIWSLV